MSLWERATRVRWLLDDARAGLRPLTTERCQALAGDPAATVLGLVGYLGRAFAYKYLP